MKIIKDFPPNIAEIRKVFNLKDPYIIFAYGDVIYAPAGQKIEDHFIKHEQVHQKQQGEDIEGWWNKYLKDTRFRLSQEIEAYQVQYQYLNKIASRPVRRNWLKVLAKDLSGEMYGNIISFQEAKQLIQNEKT